MAGTVRCIMSHPILSRTGEVGFKDVLVCSAHAQNEEHAREIAAEWAAKLLGVRHGPTAKMYDYVYSPERVYLTV